MSEDRSHLAPSAGVAAAAAPWPPSRRSRLLHLWALLTLGLLVRALAKGLGAAAPGPFDGGTGAMVTPLVLDPNQAAVAELATLPGLGPQRAAAIVLHRVRHGPFRDIADLERVDGIGPATLELLRPHVRLGAADDGAGRGSVTATERTGSTSQSGR